MLLHTHSVLGAHGMMYHQALFCAYGQLNITKSWCIMIDFILIHAVRIYNFTLKYNIFYS